jgi:hypothetical protein
MKCKNVTFLLLAVVFFAPGLTAYVFYKNPQWLGSTQINKGNLLNPPVLFTQLPGSKKWHLLLWIPGPSCDQNCIGQIDKLARTRLALGRHLYSVKQWLVVAQVNAVSPQLKKVLQEKDIAILPISERNKALFPTKAQIYLANPDKYLILSYGIDSQPASIFHDMKHLVKQNG